MGNRNYTWVKKDVTHAYDDIIDLPHYVSTTRPHMQMIDRAAQFSPFDALTGYDETITETARQTDARVELSEQELNALNETLIRLCERCEQARHERFHGDEAAELPRARVTWFVPDRARHRNSRKTGGSYLTFTGTVRQVDLIGGTIVFRASSGQPETLVPLADISDLLLLQPEREADSGLQQD